MSKIVTLPVGLTLAGIVYKEIEIRAPSLGDMMDAEEEASPTQPIAFRAALLAATTVKLGDYPGNLTLKQLRQLDPRDWTAITTAMRELEAEGEGVPASASAS